ncbi:hypothetical protein E1211_15195 [Micromonospora sp. 15K316]|uniref:hypothetical protein n=1 Tax=unclassified Micromonospora TaxID=2617518 RepID=UPI00104B4050|nr:MULTISPECIES: hypothetical protein [unclassified Micromonospora]TDB71809.1 hypothetical protein E1165_22030 [Micromonospora sp. KC723]TDC35652.1 hypothetical protein E1211_15195 [Micromonospora sp. 15K316]
MTDPLGPVQITPRDIYDQVVLLRDTVNKLVNQGAGHGEDLRDHETRLRSLESRQWPLPAAAVLLSLAALGTAVLPQLVN